MSIRECRHCGATFEFNENDGRLRGKVACSENCRKRYCAKRHRATCVDCSATLAEGSEWKRGTRCVPCFRAWQAEQRRERDEHIVAWWAEGLSLHEISLRLGWSEKHLSVELQRLRAKGHDLPYRYPGMKNPAFPHLQKAA